MIALLLASASLAQADPAPWIPDVVAGHELGPAAEAELRAIAARSDRLGQGLPGPTRHPMSVEVCRQRRTAAQLPERDLRSEAACGRPYMVPLYDPATQQPGDAEVCIDAYEFPGLPCRYPVIWARAAEAARICEVVGKRLCDAHEWEGACAGQLRPPDYRFDLAAGVAPGAAQKAMRMAHNAAEEPSRSWATGPTRPAPGVCAQGSAKSDGCDGSDPRRCGSNTYPTGAFPSCVSPLGAYDLHGNAAEHMNLPLTPEQRARRGGPLGHTEMKGSWFIFDSYAAHEDWCRWRAPYWHGGPVAAADSHRNYHLGFRCCADVRERP